jgi:hypothetical protein
MPRNNKPDDMSEQVAPDPAEKPAQGADAVPAPTVPEPVAGAPGAAPHQRPWVAPFVLGIVFAIVLAIGARAAFGVLRMVGGRFAGRGPGIEQKWGGGPGMRGGQGGPGMRGGQGMRGGVPGGRQGCPENCPGCDARQSGGPGNQQFAPGRPGLRGGPQLAPQGSPSGTATVPNPSPGI